MKLSVLLPLALAALPAAEDRRVMFDFGPADDSRWSTIHDTVMGGRSQGRLDLTEAGTLRFTGKLSLENNGGFTSFRSNSADLDLAGSTGVELRVRGDGRRYIFSTERRDVPLFGGGYWQEFPTEDGEWTTVRLPWSGFVPTSFGRQVDGLPAFDPAALSSVGVYLYDKKAGPFALELDEISAYWAEDAAPAPAPAFPDDFGTVLSLATTLGIDGALAGLDGEFTLFAPTDAAFQALPVDSFQALARPENAELLEAILLHHVVPGRFPAERAVGLSSAPTLGGGTLALALDDAGLRIEQARVVATDLEFAGGVVHAIDAVMIPAEVAELLEGAAAEDEGPLPGVSTVFSLVEAAGLTEALAERERFTLFAPSDAAFAALPEEAVAALLRPENREELRRVLLHHVVEGGVTAYQALSLTSGGPAEVAALDGSPLALSAAGGALTVSGAAVERADVLLGNAVIHVVDAVLLPAGLDLAPADPVEDFLVEVVDRGSAAFNAGDTVGCASSYRTALQALVRFGELEDPELLATVERALRRSAGEGSRQAAWTLRRAIDEVRLSR
jgi:uncharacterized surface protein with fasciclin (FAS1) repeats